MNADIPVHVINRSGLRVEVEYVDNAIRITVERAEVAPEPRRYAGPIKRGMVFDHDDPESSGTCTRVVVVSGPGLDDPCYRDVVYYGPFSDPGPLKLVQETESEFRRRVVGGGPMDGFRATAVVEALDILTPRHWRPGPWRS